MIILKTVDLYIIKKFLGTFFFAITLLILVVIVFDISEKIDDFLEKGAPLRSIILVYYSNFIPYFINLFCPLFTFIAVIFFTSKMASNSEFIAMYSSGISLKRILFPYFISSLILAVMSFCLSNYLIPPANKKRLGFEALYIKNPEKNWDRNIYLQTEPGTFAYVESYTPETRTGYNFTLEKIGDKGLYYKLSSDIIKWDTIRKRWNIQNAFIRYIDDMKETVRTGVRIDTAFNNLKPEDFKTNVVKVEEMNYSELKNFIKREKLKGTGNVMFYEVEQYRRMMNPLSIFIFTLIGVSLSSRKVRGGIGFHLGVGVSLSFAYILFMQVSTTFAMYGNFPPLLAVCTPTIFFGILSFYLYKLAAK